MKINGIEINSNIELIDKEIIPAEKVNEVDNSSTSLSFYSDSNTFNPGYIKIKVGFNANNEENLYKLESKFMDSLDKATIEFDDMDLFFKIAYTSKEDTQTAIENNLTDGWYSCKTFTLTILKTHSRQKEVLFDGVISGTINLEGTRKTPVIISIIPTIDIIDFIISGLSENPIKIKNLKKNTEVIINAVDGKVLQSGLSKFNDMDFWEFPRLLPGANNITFSRNLCNVTIKYSPEY